MRSAKPRSILDGAVDESTKGVTLLAGFIFDVVGEFEHISAACRPLFWRIEHLDRDRPLDRAPIELYNDVCAWIEDNFGAAAIRDAGRAIGRRAFRQMTAEGGLSATPTPLEVFEKLRWAASTMIHDPQRRGWEILEHGVHHVTLRRTQTFNCMLQEGLLLSLVERAGVVMPTVRHDRCTRRGDPYCEYVVSWERGLEELG